MSTFYDTIGVNKMREAHPKKYRAVLKDWGQGWHDGVITKWNKANDRSGGWQAAVLADMLQWVSTWLQEKQLTHLQAKVDGLQKLPPYKLKGEMQKCAEDARFAEVRAAASLECHWYTCMQPISTPA
jgi:hypothetical protein